MKGRSTGPGRDPFDPLDGPVDQTLDLHGTAAYQVEAQVTNFLRQAQRRNPGGLVHLITGRGRGSVDGPVLKPMVKRLLGGKLAGLVEASGPDLDEGGYLVRLKQR